MLKGRNSFTNATKCSFLPSWSQTKLYELILVTKQSNGSSFPEPVGRGTSQKDFLVVFFCESLILLSSPSDCSNAPTLCDSADRQLPSSRRRWSGLLCRQQPKQIKTTSSGHFFQTTGFLNETSCAQPHVNLTFVPKVLGNYIFESVLGRYDSSIINTS